MTNKKETLNSVGESSIWKDCPYKPNEIYNVDCYVAMEQIPSNSVDCIYVDVPYLYKIGGAGKTDLANRLTRQKLELMGCGDFYDKSKSMAENIRIANNIANSGSELLKANICDGFDFDKFFEQAFRIMKGCNLFVWCSTLQLLDIMNCISKYTNATQNILVWCKTNPVPATNGTWLSDIEYCINVREKTSRLNDGYELKSKWFVSEINQKDKAEYEHPTIKPLDLVKKHLLHATQPNDIVLDCFLGSGTTAVAAKETGRQFIGFELDKHYYTIAKDRINGISQKDKKLKEQGVMNIFDFL